MPAPGSSAPTSETPARVQTVIFSPHADDEVLGCFSFLRPDAFVLYAGIEDRSYVSREGRLKEVEAAAALTGFRWKALGHTVNRYRMEDLIQDMEETLRELKPGTALIPQPSYNQDHRAVYDAAMVALRPHDTNWFVPEVLVFEQPHPLVWKHGAEAEPNLFLSIDIEEKIRAYALYASQVRGHRSPEVLRAIARIRGAQAGVAYAEGFTVKRLVRRD